MFVVIFSHKSNGKPIDCCMVYPTTMKLAPKVCWFILMSFRWIMVWYVIDLVMGVCVMEVLRKNIGDGHSDFEKEIWICFALCCCWRYRKKVLRELESGKMKFTYLFLGGENFCILNIIVKQILRLMIKNRVFWVSLV